MSPPAPGGAREPVATDFESLYQGDPDPYGVREHWYEQRKIGLVLGLLSRRRSTWSGTPRAATGNSPLRSRSEPSG